MAFPTETVYGLGANAFNQQAVERIFQAKERPASDPIIVHICDLNQFMEVAIDVTSPALALANEFWPGPLTIIQKRNPRVPAVVSAGLGTIAVRLPRHPVALALIRAAGVPVAAPSANRFARPSSTQAGHVLSDLEERVDMILDGGPAPIGLESSVVDVLSEPPLLLRPGGISLEDLRRIVPAIILKSQYKDVKDAEAQRSPGQLSRHYSPRTPLILVKGSADQIVGKLNAIAVYLVEHKKKVGILCADEDKGSLEGSATACLSLGSKNDLDTIGINLFSCLRQIDQAGVDFILIGEVEESGIGLAIRDRLFRASEGREIDSIADLNRLKIL